MANMIPISTVTVGSGGASSIDFTGIPQNYTDLILTVSHRTTQAVGATSSALDYRFNGSTSSRAYRWLYAEGSTVGSTNNTNALLVGATIGTTGTANTFASASIYIPNYAGNTNKSSSVDNVSEGNSTTDNQLSLISNLWSNTAAINQITIYVAAGAQNFAQYSSATLYGIRKY